MSKRDKEIINLINNKIMEERKIGEIFEHNGEWYQCVEEEKSCINCAFRGTHSIDICVSEHKCLGHSSEDMPVIFKKLEKVGEPFVYMSRTFQKLKSPDTYQCKYCYFRSQVCNPQLCGEESFLVEIKQNKEEMGENKSNLKPFDFEAAKAGKPVCTRDGRKARIICFDFQSIENTPIVAVVQVTDKQEVIANYYEDGRRFVDGISELDLIMLPEKRKGWINIHQYDVYKTKEEAEAKVSDKANYLTTIEIEYWR